MRAFAGNEQQVAERDRAREQGRLFGLFALAVVNLLFARFLCYRASGPNYTRSSDHSRAALQQFAPVLFQGFAPR